MKGPRCSLWHNNTKLPLSKCEWQYGQVFPKSNVLLLLLFFTLFATASISWGFFMRSVFSHCGLHSMYLILCCSAKFDESFPREPTYLVCLTLHCHIHSTSLLSISPLPVLFLWTFVWLSYVCQTNYSFAKEPTYICTLSKLPEFISDTATLLVTSFKTTFWEQWKINADQLFRYSKLSL